MRSILDYLYEEINMIKKENDTASSIYLSKSEASAINKTLYDIDTNKEVANSLNNSRDQFEFITSESHNKQVHEKNARTLLQRSNFV